jgi:hypothetical protein
MESKEELEIIEKLNKQIKFCQDILNANNVEEVFNLREKSGLFRHRVFSKAEQKTIEEYKAMAQESIEKLKKTIGEINGNN